MKPLKVVVTILDITTVQHPAIQYGKGTAQKVDDIRIRYKASIVWADGGRSEQTGTVSAPDEIEILLDGNL